MPKATLPSLPLSGLFGIVKPSGPTSMDIINKAKILISNSRLFVEASKLEENKGKPKGGRGRRRGKDSVKTGQGGTLDPLADGVLGEATAVNAASSDLYNITVVGVGKGTKRLNDFLDCSKEYETTCLLGCETDSYDSEGARVRTAPWRHVTREKVESALEKFRGEIMQTPPIFSALKMDGRPLYEYARKGIPLPRPIEQRKVTIHSLELIDWKGSNHSYRWPKKQFTAEEKEALQKSLSGIDNEAKVTDETDPEAPEAAEDEVPTAFVLKMKVSGGTYVRSVVHELAHAVGSAGHVVTLTRTRQKNYVIGDVEEEGDRQCVKWEVFEKALKDEGEKDEDGWTEWEREVIDKMDILDGKNTSS
ncbi:pseudouridine synthase [Dentipellis sp. KUC8613]|nr:pseudouridine synthase [Dentipellis sp. KUC8613]